MPWTQFGRGGQGHRLRCSSFSTPLRKLNVIAAPRLSLEFTSFVTRRPGVRFPSRPPDSRGPAPFLKNAPRGLPFSTSLASLTVTFQVYMSCCREESVLIHV